MRGATSGSQVGTQTSGSTVTAGANGIAGTKTVGGAKGRMFPKASPRRKATFRPLTTYLLISRF
jgi:hypothetical protein